MHVSYLKDGMKHLEVPNHMRSHTASLLFLYSDNWYDRVLLLPLPARLFSAENCALGDDATSLIRQTAWDQEGQHKEASPPGPDGVTHVSSPPRAHSPGGGRGTYGAWDTALHQQRWPCGSIYTGGGAGHRGLVTMPQAALPHQACGCPKGTGTQVKATWGQPGFTREARQ